MTVDEITTRIEQVKHYIHDCERRIAQGEAVELTGLDQNVEKICSDIATLPKEDARHLESKLVHLVTALDKLVQVIHTYEEETQSSGTDSTS